MRFSLFLLLILSAASCGLRKNEHRDYSKNNPKFDDIKKTFLEEGLKRGHNLNWRDVDIPIYFEKYRNTHGSCAWTFITIDPSLKSAEPFYLETVVLHELGHCVLKRSHVDTPLSIMDGKNRYYEKKLKYIANRKLFFDELFSRIPIHPDQLLKHCDRVMGQIVWKPRVGTRNRDFVKTGISNNFSIYGKPKSVSEYIEVFTQEKCRSEKQNI